MIKITVTFLKPRGNTVVYLTIRDNRQLFEYFVHIRRLCGVVGIRFKTDDFFSHETKHAIVLIAGNILLSYS